MLRKIKGILSVFAVCAVFTMVAGQTTQWFQIRGTAGKGIDYIIDAGHGIPDGGAVAADGTTEQQLNLAIAKKLSVALKKKDIGCLLTREDENSIYSEGKSIHAKKVSDIKNRVEIAKQNPKTPLISIHMNSYPNASVHGIQVFYRANDEASKKIAAELQSAFNDKIQPENRKVIKEISSNIYLFSHIENPAILIECGFLSNSDELASLKTEKYQSNFAQIIADTLPSYG